MSHLSYVEVDLAAIKSNCLALKRLCPAAEKVVAVVKANAYGHGLEQVVVALEEEVGYFGVDDLDELLSLRKLTAKPALVLGYIARDDIEQALVLGAEIAVYDVHRLAEIARVAKLLGARQKVHLKIDALLGRQGLLPVEVPKFLDELMRYPAIELVAAYSHFANIEDTTDLTHASLQSAHFGTAFCQIQLDWPNVQRHESATSGVMLYENSDTGNLWIRLGIGLYGLYPSASISSRTNDVILTPALRWVSHLAQVKSLPMGHPVGYGLTYITARETRIGIVPMGYSDGFDRGLSGRGSVLVRGKRCPVLGRIAMNMFAIDLTDVDGASPEDEVILLGSQGQDAITAEEIAALTDTINYEVVARTSPILPRTVRT